MLCGFFHTTRQINHNYTYTTSLLSLPPLPRSYPSRSPQSTGLGSLHYIATSHQPFILQMVVYMCQRHLLHSSHSIFPHCVHKSIPYLSLHSFPKNSFINTIFLDSIYMLIPYIYIPYILISRLIYLFFFFLTYSV